MIFGTNKGKKARPSPMGMMERKNIKRMIKNGEVAVGVTCHIFDPIMAELAALAGFDYIRMDGEHSGIDFADISRFVRAADGEGIPVIIRWTRPEDLSALCELGVAGFQFPHVQNAQQAGLLVERTKYAPVGLRGFTDNMRAQKYGLTDFQEYVKRADDEVLLIVQIEDKYGIENMEEIIAVEGVDVICTGKGDISQSLGILGDFHNPRVDEVENRIISLAQKYNKPTLVMGNNRQHWIDLVKNKSVAMVEYVQDVTVILNALRREREAAQYLKDAKSWQR